MIVGCTKYSDKPKGETSTSGLTTIACDNTFENIIQDEIDVFEFVYPDVNILADYTNETACFDSLLNLKIKTIVVSRDLTADEVKYLKNQKKRPKSKQIAVDAIALIVNNDNPNEILSTEEISEILTGRITNWNEISPAYSGEIQVIFDHAGSSTVNYLKNKLTSGEPFNGKIYTVSEDTLQGSCEKVIDAVKSRKGALGIIGVSWLTRDLNGKNVSVEEKAEMSVANDTIMLSSTNDEFTPEIKVLKVREMNKLQAYKPFQEDIYNGDYPFYRSIYMITTGEGGMPSHGFFSFVTGVQGQKIMLRTGVLPAIIHTKNVELQ